VENVIPQWGRAKVGPRCQRKRVSLRAGYFGGGGVRGVRGLRRDGRHRDPASVVGG
jgi:hypothetical protein